MHMPRVPGEMAAVVHQPLKGLGELYENSLKAMLVCGLEFYLSASLVASFFQCPDESVQAEQELQTLYTMAWVPLVLATMLVYGPRLSSTIFPSPEHFERNVLRCKILTWIYAFCFLIWDPDMVVKTGPSLGVSVLFCVTDVGRFVMDMKHLTATRLSSATSLRCSRNRSSTTTTRSSRSNSLDSSLRDNNRLSSHRRRRKATRSM